MNDFVIVMTTTDSTSEAEKLSRGAVERRLAACVQMTSITSTYWWNDAVEQGEEYLLLFKTPSDRASDLRQFLSEVHSYDTPEIIEVPISTGGQSYLDWMISSTRT